MKDPVITQDPAILSGAPVFTGTRVPVQTLIDTLKAGDSLDDFLLDFPSVSRDQAQAFLDLALKAALAEGNKRPEEPDLKIGNFEVWVHGRQFPDSYDYWDGNWLNVTAHCSAEGADVCVTGNIIHLSEIFHFVTGLEKLHSTLQCKARLACMEPELCVKMAAKSVGHIEMVVAITPDNLAQAHRFTFVIDQGDLPGAIAGCKTILDQYPIRVDP